VTAESEVSGAQVRTHVNRLKKVPLRLVETCGAASGNYPDTRRLISAIVESESDGSDASEVRYKVRSVGRFGYRWMTELPDVVKCAYELATADYEGAGL
jgi:hypothetical protein